MLYADYAKVPRNLPLGALLLAPAGSRRRLSHRGLTAQSHPALTGRSRLRTAGPAIRAPGLCHPAAVRGTAPASLWEADSLRSHLLASASEPARRLRPGMWSDPGPAGPRAAGLPDGPRRRGSLRRAQHPRHRDAVFGGVDGALS